MKMKVDNHLVLMRTCVMFMLCSAWLSVDCVLRVTAPGLKVCCSYDLSQMALYSSI
jgi:hypothetical protein